MSMLDINEVKYCKNCGAKKSPSFKYCLHCGTKIEEETFFMTETKNNQFQSMPEPQKEIVIDQNKVENVIETPPIQKYCPKCGMEVIQEDKYCIECGYRKPSVYVQKNITDEEKQKINPIWTVLLYLSIINMVVVGTPAGFATLIGLSVLLYDFDSGIVPVLMSGSILALSIFAIKFFSDKTSIKRG